MLKVFIESEREREREREREESEKRGQPLLKTLFAMTMKTAFDHVSGGSGISITETYREKNPLLFYVT